MTQPERSRYCCIRCGTLVMSAILGLLSIGTINGSVHAEEIQLATGEVLKVEVREVTAETVHVVHPVLGKMSLPRESVTLLERQDDEYVPVEDAPAVAETTEEPSDVEWSTRLTLAGSYATGNTESANVTSRLRVERTTERTRTSFDAGYFFGSRDGERSEHRFTTGLRNDWLIPDSKWFIFADARYDFDEFQSWKHRVSGHVGAGYELFQPPPLALNLLGGFGAIKEWGSDNEDVRPEALVGFEGRWDISERQTLDFSSIAYLDLDDLGEFRWVNSLEWAHLLDNDLNLSLTAGLEHEYQSIVDPGRERHDLRLYAGLRMDF